MEKCIPTYARFQWINHPLVRTVLAPFFPYAGTGRRGYDKVTLFLWLAYKQLHGCTYRDLESMSGIDQTTFVKFRGRLKQSRGFEHLFGCLTQRVLAHLPALNLILDSSFVKTYSGHDEEGSAYSGHKKANGYKTHEIIDRDTRLPVFQSVTPGAVADITEGRRLVSRAPPDLPVASFAADKGYDSESFVFDLARKWSIEPAIPLRRMKKDGNRTN
ncbi:MAG: transposase [bacterium]